MQNPSLDEIRHSASHVLAQAVLHFFPNAKLGIGPVIDDGFYYDFDLAQPLSSDDLVKLEDKMRQIIRESQAFVYSTLPSDKAIERMRAQNQPYKVEIIQDLGVPEVGFYENGPFLDLCKGPHVQNTAQIPVVKLLKVSGAYWRGDEKRPMLQRIYGTAFFTQAELDQYLDRCAQAERRDHRLLGKTLDLFSIHQEEIGGGLILWHPKGALVRHLIETYWKQAHLANGYHLLNTPHIGKSTLWETSGHLSNYQDNMFAPMHYEGHDYFVKPMNCPFHILIYKNTQHSYRELPLRLAELGTVYRHERSGVLHGLMRVRGFTQDDAHIVCRPDQVETEIKRVLRFCLAILNAFGFTQYKVYLATQPKEKSVGDPSQWALAQKALQDSVDELQIPFEMDEGGGAFYGPKIDLKIQDAIGREWQCSTIQFDFNLPERFGMQFVGQDGQRHTPYMIHRAIFGSIERFFGILIEHYEGEFPLWLAPVQVRILSVQTSVLDYAQDIANLLQKSGIRVEIDDSDEKVGYKIRQAISEKIPYLIVIGAKEKDAGLITVRTKKSDQVTQTADEWISSIQDQLGLPKITLE